MGNKGKEIAAKWLKRGKYVKVKNHRFFVIDEGDKGLPVLLILHGYPSCSFDYIHVLPILCQHFRVVIHDHLGFGYSDKPLDYSYSLLDQAQYALELWKVLEINEANLLAHDYGSSVATEILALRKEQKLSIEIKTLTLTNGSIHIEMAKLRFIQKMLRNKIAGPIVAMFGNEFIFKTQMRKLWYNQSKVDISELQALWTINISGSGRKVLPKITQYLNERYTYWDRWIGALKTLDLPCHVLWAQDDPVSVKAIGEQIYLECPTAIISRLKHLGHYPMLEDPERWAKEVIGFLNIDMAKL